MKRIFLLKILIASVLCSVMSQCCDAQQKTDSTMIVMGTDTIYGMLYPSNNVKEYVQNILSVVEYSTDYFTPTLEEAIKAECILKENLLRKYRHLSTREKKGSKNDRIVSDNRSYIRQYVGYYYKGERRILVVASFKSKIYSRLNGCLGLGGWGAGDDYWKANLNLKRKKILRLRIGL